MSLRFVLLTAGKDLRRRATDPLALLLWLGLPLMIGGLMWLVGGGGSGASPRGVVLLADEDASLLGRVVQGSFAQGPLSALLEVERTTREEGRARLESGNASALIVIPAGATDAIVDGTPVTLTLVTNPAQRILPGIVREALELLAEAAFYGQRLFDAPLRDIRDRVRADDDDFLPTAEVVTIAGAINERLRGLRHVLFPPVLDFDWRAPAGSGEAGAAGPAFDIGQLFLPGLLFLSLLFIAQAMSGDVWEEQVQGTLRRALASPPGVTGFLLGKLAAGAVLIGAIAAAGLGVGLVLFHVPLARAALAWPWCLFGGTVLLALFLVPQFLAGSRRGANMLGTIVIFPLMMLGGSFFPFEAMPAWMAAIGRWTPNGQAVARLKDLLAGTAEGPPFLVAIVAMGLPAAAAVLFAAARLRRRFEGGA
jgi:hypothetical protein